MGFDFAGTFTKVDEHKLIESTFGEAGVLLVEFIAAPDGVTVRRKPSTRRRRIRWNSSAADGRRFWE